MNNEPNKPAQELTEKELEGIVGGKEGMSSEALSPAFTGETPSSFQK